MMFFEELQFLYFENAQDYIIHLLKRWELRLIMLLSLLLQVLLVTLGSRRRYVHRRLQLIVWCAYRMADSVATLGLGVISSLLSQMKVENYLVKPDMQLMAFWSSILLLHLAGPDTITAYTTEDNEMWLPHLLKLLVPLGVVGYIYFMFLVYSPFSIMALTIISIGLVKYVERTLSRFLTSKNQLVEWFPSPKPSRQPFLIPDNSKDHERSAGTMDAIDEEQQRDPIANDHGRMSSTIYLAINAYDKMKILFIDGFLSDSVVQRLLKKTMSKMEKKKKIFRIVEVELGLVKELLYTKVMILSNQWGVFSRAATVSALGIVLVLSSVEIIHRNNHYIDPINAVITILLVTMSFLLELLSALLMLSSNWSSPWMSSRWFIGFLRRNAGGTPKWRCGVVAQFSVLHFSLHKSSSCLQKVPKVEKLLRQLQEYFFVTYKELIVKEVQEWIYHRVNEKVNELDGDPSKIKAMLSGFREGNILKEKWQVYNLAWRSDGDVGFGFDECILVWHITTEICYYTDRKDMKVRDANAVKNYKMSKMISRYMIYLLLVYPSMLSIQDTNKFRYDKTSVAVRNIFKKMPTLKKIRRDKKRGVWWKLKDKQCSSCTTLHKRDHSWFLCESCHKLLGDNKYLYEDDQGEANNEEGKGTSSVFHNALSIAKSMSLKGLDSKWEEIGRIWVEALLFVAGSSSGPEHAKSLGQGEELLSHVWLLMAHFGIAKQII